MPARHAAENDGGEGRRRDVDGKEGRRAARTREREGKSLQPVSEGSPPPSPPPSVPGQSIKNVSRAEIIKVRISGGQAGEGAR